MTDHTATKRVAVGRLTKSFSRRNETVQVLKGLDVSVGDGELLVLLGPSGCGKTTLLNCLVGLERPDGGTIDLGDRTVVDVETGVFVPPNKRDIGMVFQNYALWPHMTVAQNVEYPLTSRGMRADRAARVREVLEIVQCGHLADRYPPELSGGQQQRVALARALASKPLLMLLDEPLSNLDALLRIELRAQLRQVHRAVGFTGVYVTHDQEEALALGDRVAVMREGRFEQIGTPDEVHSSPATEFVADFLGARNAFDVESRDSGAFAGDERLGGWDDLPSGSYRIRVRPTQVTVSTGEETLPSDAVALGTGVVDELLPAGDRAEYVIRQGDRTLFATVSRVEASARPGDPVHLHANRAAAFAYGADDRLVTAGAGR